MVDRGRHTAQLELLSPDAEAQDGIKSPMGTQSVRGPGGAGAALSKSTVGSIMVKKKPEKKINVTAKIFEAIIMTLILVSSVTLVIDKPLADPDAPDIVMVGYLDNCFTVLFTIEALVKIIATGFLFNNATLKAKGMTPYIRNPWNMLDFVVVLSSLIDFIFTLKGQPDAELNADAP